MTRSYIFDRPVDRVLEDLPVRIRGAFRSVWERRDDGSDLCPAVGRHLAELEASIDRNEFLDIALARTLAARNLRLLEWAARADASDNQLGLVRAAVRYFVLTADGDSDADSIIGLEDDAVVLAAVARELGCVEILGD